MRLKTAYIKNFYAIFNTVMKLCSIDITPCAVSRIPRTFLKLTVQIRDKNQAIPWMKPTCIFSNVAQHSSVMCVRIWFLRKGKSFRNKFCKTTIQRTIIVFGLFFALELKIWKVPCKCKCAFNIMLLILYTLWTF